MLPNRLLCPSIVTVAVTAFALPAAADAADLSKAPRVKGTVTIERTEEVRTGGEFDYTVESSAKEKLTFSLDLRPTPGNPLVWKPRPGKVNFSHTLVRTNVQRAPDNKPTCTLTTDRSYTRVGQLRPLETRRQGELGYGAARAGNAMRVDINGYLEAVTRTKASPFIPNLCGTDDGETSAKTESATGPGAQVYERCYPSGAGKEARSDSVSALIWGVWRKAKRRYDFQCKLDADTTTEGNGFRNVSIKVTGFLKQY